MMLLLRLAVRNARRNTVRTLLTALTVTFGTAVLTVAMAWITGVFGDVLGTAADAAGHVRVVDPDFASREQMNPLYEHVTGVAARAEAIAAMPGVSDVAPRIMTGVSVSVGDEIGEVFALAMGAPKAYYERRMRFDEHLVEGSIFPGQSPKEIVLGATVAKRAGVKIGDDIVLFGQTQDGSMSPLRGPLVGIVHTGTAAIDQGAFVLLERMMYMADIDDAATEILVFGEDRDDAPALAATVSAAPELNGLTVQAWTHREPWSGMLAIADVVRGILVAIVVFITALGVWNTMMMSVMERTSEIGVMRSMGLSRMGAVFLFVSEAGGIAVLGGLLGVAIGGAAARYLEVVGVTLGEATTAQFPSDIPMKATLYADMRPDIAMTAFLLALLMAAIGSALPSLRAASIAPVEAMRTGRR